jgi:hypothetical protein
VDDLAHAEARRELAQVLVMNTGGSQPELAALALTTSERNVAHWAPSGTAMITSGAFEAIEFT